MEEDLEDIELFLSEDEEYDEEDFYDSFGYPKCPRDFECTDWFSKQWVDEEPSEIITGKKIRCCRSEGLFKDAIAFQEIRKVIDPKRIVMSDETPYEEPSIRTSLFRDDFGPKVLKKYCREFLRLI